MPKYKAILVAATLALGLPGSVHAQSETAPAMDATADTVVATVNGTTITVGNLIVAVQSLSDEEKKYPDDVLLKGLTERLIQQAAISAAQTDLTTAMQLKLTNERNALIASDAVEAMAATITVTDADLQAAYDARFADFTPTTEYNASHILVATEDEAKALVTELEGGTDFADLAKAKSTGPSGPSGGALGWFGKGQMVPPFEAAVATMEVGAISAPVKTDFGWHIIKLNETRIPEVPTLDQLKNKLQTEVYREQLFAKINAVVDSATIERTDLSKVDPAVLRDLSLVK